MEKILIVSDRQALRLPIKPLGTEYMTSDRARDINPLNQAKIDLTAALRLASRMGLSEGVCNHFSMEKPGDADLFLINPQGLHWSEVTPTDIVTVDSDGNVVAGKHSVEPTAFNIHGRIHKDKKWKVVLHTHMPYATALTLIQGGELNVLTSQNAMRYLGRVSYDRAYGGMALDSDEGARITNAMGDADVVFLQHHGVVVCGENMAYAFDDLYYLERACMVQVLAQSTGGNLQQADVDTARLTASQIAEERQQSVFHFDALKRLLDRDEPGWSAT